MKLYLAGPMTGYKDYNFPAFHEYAALLRGVGHEVYNPADKESGPDGLPDLAKMPVEWGGTNTAVKPGDIRAMDIENLLKQEAVAFMPGWTGSNGALGEGLVAQLVAKPIFIIGFQGTLIPLRNVKLQIITTQGAWRDSGNVPENPQI